MFLNTTGKFFVDFCGPMLLQSSVLIVLLLVLDVLFLKKVRAVFRYCVWMLVLVKLVLPTTLALPTGPGYWFGDKLTFGKTEMTGAVDRAVVSDQKLMYEIPAVAALSSRVDIPGTGMISAERPREFIAAELSPAIENSGAVIPVARVSLCWEGFAFLVWAGAVAAMILLLIQRMIFVKGLVGQSKEPDEPMAGLFGRCQKQMKVRGKINLRVSPVATSPSVCGLFRTVVLMPENLPGSLERGDLRAVLLHELAHIKRGDLPVSFVQTMLQIIYFYNPLLWAANAMIRKIREQAVDEMVLAAMGERAADYPETLLNVSRLTFSRPVLSLRLIGVVESKKALSGRIRHILSRPFPKKSRLGFAGLAAVIVAGLILLPMAKAGKEPEFIIKGTVTDVETGEPIAGAKVGDVEQYAKGEYSTITDTDGNYEYKTWYEEHDVKAEAAGYKTKSKSFKTKFFGSEKEKVIDFELTAGEAGDKTEVQVATASAAVTQPKVREVIETRIKEVYLPNYDGDRLQILDLESGELVDLPNVEDDFELFAAVLDSNKGEIVYDRFGVDGRRRIAHLNISKQDNGAITIADGLTYFWAESGQIPRSETIMTRKGEGYKVRFVEADDKGCTIKFFPLSKAKVIKTRGPRPTPVRSSRSSRTTSSVPVPRTTSTGTTRSARTSSVGPVSRTPSRTNTSAAAVKKAITEKLQILRMRQDTAEQELQRAEKVLESIRRSTAIGDLEDRGYPHPITARLTRLQRERDDCVLEVNQLRTRIEVMRQNNDLDAKIEKAELDLAGLHGKLEELKKMVEEAKAEESELNHIRSEYQRHVAMRDERRESLKNIKAQMDELEIAYMEAGTSVSTSTRRTPEPVTTLMIEVYDRSKYDPSKGEVPEEISLNIPLAGLDVTNIMIPEQAQKQMDKYGITLEGIVEKVKNGLRPTKLLQVEDGSCQVEISVE